MTYNQYVEEIFSKRLKLDWTSPYRWSMSNGLSALSSAVKLALKEGREKPWNAPTRNVAEHEPFEKRLRSGFLCRGSDTPWSWLLLKQDFEWLRNDPEYSGDFEAFRTEGIPQGMGMVGNALDVIRDPEKFNDCGLFDTLKHSKFLTGGAYSEKLQKAERHTWPTDEFITMFFLGFARLTENGLAFYTVSGSLDSLPKGSIAIVFVFSVGKEPLAPGRVTDTVNIISESKRFFGRFLEVNSPLMAVFADALGRSAVAAVMARNVSHNIGSHVSPRTTIEAIRERLISLGALREGSAEEEMGGEEERVQAQNELLIVRTLRKRLDEYTQKKSDFLAEITTEPLTTSRTARFFWEVVLPFVSNTLLIDTLTANEGLRYRDLRSPSLLLRCCHRGREVFATFAESADLLSKSTYRYRYPPQLPYTLFPERPPEVELKADSQLQVFGTHFEDGSSFEDFEVELPGPLGEFAFYAFIENLIRNSAKHNRDLFSGSKPPNLEITIDVRDEEEDAEKCRVTVYDNVTDPDRSAGGVETVGDLLGRLVTLPLVDADGNLRKSAWGIAEMRICATLLGGSTDFVKAEPLKVERRTDLRPDHRPCLAYSFNLVKPRRVCALVRPTLAPERVQTLKKNGIHVFDKAEDLKVYIEATEQSAASFRFFVVDCKSDAPCDCTKVSGFIQGLPFRRIVSHRTSCDELLMKFGPRGVQVASDDPDWLAPAAELEHWCWRSWIGRWLGGGARTEPEMEVHVYLDQEEREEPTKRWSKALQDFSANPENSAIQARVWSTNARAELGKELIPASSAHPRLFIDRHLYFLDNIAHFRGKLHGGDSCILLDKNNVDFLKLFQPTISADARWWTLPYQLAEAGLLRVAVIDERLAEAAVRGLDDGKIGPCICDGVPQGWPCIWHVARAANILVCTHLRVSHGGKTSNWPLHPSSFRDRESAWEKTGIAVPFFEVAVDDGLTAGWSTDHGRAPMHSLGGPLDALVIHQGILDTVEREMHLPAADLLQRLSKHIPFLVVDSGRGMPLTLARDAKFLPFSLLQDYVGDIRTAKYSLTQVLMSLTRRSGWRPS